jgi:hypothetical protein
MLTRISHFQKFRGFRGEPVSTGRLLKGRSGGWYRTSCLLQAQRWKEWRWALAEFLIRGGLQTVDNGRDLRRVRGLNLKVYGRLQIIVKQVTLVNTSNLTFMSSSRHAFRGNPMWPGSSPTSTGRGPAGTDFDVIWDSDKTITF